MATLTTAPPRFARAGSVLAAAVTGGVLMLALAATHRSPVRNDPPPPIERQARRFVSLALTLGAVAPAEVDSYFGPGDIRPVAAKPSLPELRADLGDLAAELHAGTAPDDVRRAGLRDRTDRLLALVNIMGPVPQLPFDAEASEVYGLPRLTVDGAEAARARARLAALLPGDAPLDQRAEAFRHTYLIPPDRRAAVFASAVAECRRHTLRHWRLPAAERLDVEWTDRVDAAWHRYRGGFHSTLQINPNAVAFLGSAVQVACHEAYPGHHAQFVLADVAAGPGGPPVEDRIVLLRSPASVVREGAAEYGASLAFSPAERLAFDRDVLMPLAGLPAAGAARFEEIRALLDELTPAAFPILRAYRDGRLDASAAAAALRHDALLTSPEALLAFTDGAGAYIAGYSAVREVVRRQVAGPGDAWGRLRCLVVAADRPLTPPPPAAAGSLASAREVSS